MYLITFLLYTIIDILAFVIHMSLTISVYAKRLLCVLLLLCITSASVVRAYEGVVGPGDRSGRPRGDELRGPRGDDRLFGFAGNDNLYGGPGNDRV